ncbi:unnamed protein product, partial [Iphiclides podalirius]
MPLGRGRHIKRPAPSHAISLLRIAVGLVFCAALLLAVAAAPADVEQLEPAPEKEDLQVAASHWGGWGGHGGYGGLWGGWGGYYPHYASYWSWPLYGHGYGYGWPYGYGIGHHGYWWK